MPREKGVLTLVDNGLSVWFFQYNIYEGTVFKTDKK